jgi:hypothetical protein
MAPARTRGRRPSRTAAGALAGAITWSALALAGGGLRTFPDRAVAWHEHDDEDVSRPPAATHLQDLPATLLLRDSLAGEVDRVLAVEGPRPARDVNALDEVPCSTWFCPRNHLTPLTPEEAALGPPAAVAPRVPLRIVKGKEDGASAGYQVVDAAGRRFMLKLDPAGHLGLTTGAEMIGERLFHAAGYNVPGAFLLDVGPGELAVDPGATYRLFKVEPRPLTDQRVRASLGAVAGDGAGRVRAVLTPWLPGTLLGGFDTIGRRADDPNDRIEHQDRRSLRASWVLFAWLGEVDPGSINSLDAYVSEDGRRFVRHYVIDFGATLGSFSTRPRGVHEGAEHILEVGRTLGSLASFGLYRRPFEEARSEWEAAVAERPSVGWFPGEGFDPEEYRPRTKVPAHMRRTDRDLYWGAKVVTSFSDAQLAAVVATARLGAADAAHVQQALRARRDVIGRLYLRRQTAVESPDVSPDGAAVCFDDLAIARGYAASGAVRYEVEVLDGQGRRLTQGQRAATGARTCVAAGTTARGDGYRVVRVTAVHDGGAGRQAQRSKPARVHLRWRETAGRFVVVGLERDE